MGKNLLTAFSNVSPQFIRFNLTNRVIQEVILAYTKFCSAIFWVHKKPTPFD